MKGSNLDSNLTIILNDQGRHSVNSKVKPCKFFSESPRISIHFSSDTSQGTLHKAQGSLLSESAAFPRAHACWTATPASWFALSYGCTNRAAVVWGGPALYCQQPKQLPWAHGLHALSLGSPFSLEWLSGAQQCHLRWLRHSGPCLTRDYTKQALF